VTTGRPSKYKPEYAEQAEKLCRLGASDIQLAEFFNVEEKTIYNWKDQYSAFLQATRAGKTVYDDPVEQSLAKSALGFKRSVERLGKDGCPIECFEEVPPNPVSAIFWLKNRRPDRWRDKQEHEVSGPGGVPLVPVINLTLGKPDGEK
jgi:transposase-like protein